jgi:hypothetical protein
MVDSIVHAAGVFAVQFIHQRKNEKSVNNLPAPWLVPEIIFNEQINDVTLIALKV